VHADARAVTDEGTAVDEKSQSLKVSKSQR
jgi:hypothetical protein